MSVSPARSATYRVLAAVRERDAFAPEVLNAVLREAGLDRSDSALTTRLVYGSLQVLGTLDELIDTYATTPSRIEAPVRDVIRVGVYEILFAGAPHHAAVHQAVEAVRSFRPRAAGMVNAVLRRVSDVADTFPFGDPETDTAVLARAYGHPRWLVEMWLEQIGPGPTRDILAANNEVAPLYLRHLPFHTSFEDALTVLETDGAGPAACGIAGCVWAAKPAAAVNGRAVREHLFLVTDAAAQFATVAADPAPGDVVVEIGSGRGTKSLELQALAWEAGGPCEVVAVDIHPRKTAILRERARALGVSDIEAVTADATDLAQTPGVPGEGEADVVLVDAPCSGLGALRRHPMKRWRVGPEDPGRLFGLQTALLASAARLVRPGGVIVYSTCTVSQVENQQVVQGFLDGDPGQVFTTRPLRATVPSSWEQWITPEGWFQSLPAIGGPDGHFVARLERAG